MTTDDLVTDVGETLRGASATVTTATAGVALILFLGALVYVIRRLRRSGQREWATRVQLLSTVLGLAWSAQGMYSAAIDRYDLNRAMALVLFAVFEFMLINRMIKASEYRDRDRRVRNRHVRWVWAFGIIMALVVATAEGWGQAPARLMIPLLVVAGWYLDLTGDDDPDEKLDTEWNWTPRDLLLRVGALKYRASDRKTQTEAERQALSDRLARLGLADRIGSSFMNTFLRRRARLARLMADADAELTVEARVRVARAATAYNAGLGNPEPERAPRREAAPERPVPVPARIPTGQRVRVADGVVVEDYAADAIKIHLASRTKERPQGMTAAELAKCYSPPMSLRTAEGLAAQARKQATGVLAELNGHSAS